VVVARLDAHEKSDYLFVSLLLFLGDFLGGRDLLADGLVLYEVKVLLKYPHPRSPASSLAPSGPLHVPVLLRGLLPGLVVVVAKVDSPPLSSRGEAAPSQLVSPHGPFAGVLAARHRARDALLHLAHSKTGFSSPYL